MKQKQSSVFLLKEPFQKTISIQKNKVKLKQRSPRPTYFSDKSKCISSADCTIVESQNFQRMTPFLRSPKENVSLQKDFAHFQTAKTKWFKKNDANQTKDQESEIFIFNSKLKTNQKQHQAQDYNFQDKITVLKNDVFKKKINVSQKQNKSQVLKNIKSVFQKQKKQKQQQDKKIINTNGNDILIKKIQFLQHFSKQKATQYTKDTKNNAKNLNNQKNILQSQQQQQSKQFKYEQPQIIQLHYKNSSLILVKDLSQRSIDEKNNNQINDFNNKSFYSTNSKTKNYYGFNLSLKTQQMPLSPNSSKSKKNSHKLKYSSIINEAKDNFIFKNQQSVNYRIEQKFANKNFKNQPIFYNLQKSPSFQMVNYPSKTRLCISDFLLLREICRSKHGLMVLSILKKNGFVCTIEIVQKKAIINDNEKKKFIRQLKIRLKIDHPHIIKCYDIFDSKNKIYIVQEYLSYVPFIINEFRIKDQDAVSKFIKQICMALSELHKHNIIYNKTFDQDFFYSMEVVKLKNFSSILRMRNAKTQFQELSLKEYNEKIDVFHIGKLTQKLLLFDPNSKTNSPRNGNQISQQYNYSQLSSFARDFLERSLNKFTFQRLNLKQQLNHPFLQEQN